MFKGSASINDTCITAVYDNFLNQTVYIILNIWLYNWLYFIL